MRLSAHRPPVTPMVARVRAAELVRLCPACEEPLDDDSPPGGNVAVQACRRCGMRVITPRHAWETR